MYKPASERIRGVLLDRDFTVAHASPERASARDAQIGRLLGAEGFVLTPELKRAAEVECMDWRYPVPAMGLDIEGEHCLRFFAAVLNLVEYNGDVFAAAAELAREYMPYKMLAPYADVAPVMKALRQAGVRIGIISNSFPSLEASFREMGLDQYVDGYTSAYRVGWCKPQAPIYHVALRSLGVAAGESLFVDDMEENVEAAIQLGMTAFRIDRDAPRDDLAKGVISTLRPLLAVLGIEDTSDVSEKHGGGSLPREGAESLVDAGCRGGRDVSQCTTT